MMYLISQLAQNGKVSHQPLCNRVSPGIRF